MSIISSVEASLLLSRIESEGKLLQVVFCSRDGSIGLQVKARVGVMSEESLSLLSRTQDFCTLSLRDCKFEYQGEGKAPTLIREEWIRTVEGTLEILFPSGERISLHMFRDIDGSKS